MSCYLNFDDLALGFSVHASKRAAQRGVSRQMVAHILKFGRKHYQNGSVYYSVGRKEIKKFEHLCSALKNMNGLHLVMAKDGKIITVFKNQNFKIIRRN